MNLMLRLTLTLGFVGGGLALAARDPEWLRPEVDQPDRTSDVLYLEPPSDELLAVTRRIQAKSHVIEKLLAGELKLVEAAAWFRRLDAAPPAPPCVGWKRLPGNTPNEKLCRQVIGWTEAQLINRATKSEIAAVTCRLEEELQRQLAATGTVELPGIGGDE
jgi:hypothetical protein